MVSSGANKKSRKKGVFGKRIGKSYEELKNFDILSFLGGGLESQTSGGMTMKTGGSSSHGISDGVSIKHRTHIGVSYDIFTKFPLFKKGSTPHYQLHDLPTNMGIVRTRGRSIDRLDKEIQQHRVEMKELDRKDSRRQQKITTRQKWIKEKTYLKKKYKHEMDYRLKLLKEVAKRIDIEDKGSLVKPYGKYKTYYFRIYWWGKKVPIYLGQEKDLKMGFKRQEKHKDFDEWLKDYGRRLFRMKLGSDESTYRKAQRILRKMKTK